MPAIAAVGLSAMLVFIGSQTATSAASNERAEVANPATFSYTYHSDEVVAVVPTPNSTDQGKVMNLHFSCDARATLTVENTSNGYIKAFDASRMGEMIAANVTEENPCYNGLSPADTDNLGNIAVKNGFATYNIPTQAG